MNKTTDKTEEDEWNWLEVYRDLKETSLGLHRKREPLPMNLKQNKSEDINKTSEEDTNKTTDKSEEDNGDWFYQDLKETSLGLHRKRSS